MNEEEKVVEFDVLDTHDAVLDISDVVFTADQLVNENVIVDADYIIVKLDDLDDHQPQI